MSTNPRHLAICTAVERPTVSIERPRDSDGNYLPVEEVFGRRTFGTEQMRKHLTGEQFRRFHDVIERGERLGPDLANQIAQGVKDWALVNGVSHFCHWFQPMTGATAEKHDAFIAFDDGRPVAAFTGAQLIQSEPDASSFPSGGMRSTFEARGYTAWDPTSPMFIMETPNGSTLSIPSVFVTYHGDAMDKKAPLLRSMQAIGRQAVRLCGLLGETDVGKVTPSAGPEQEYFLVDRAYTAFRPDLKIAGRTVLGAPSPKGQSLDDHYFGAIPARVLAFMNHLEAELYELGVPAKTRHNEVAPSQFEIAVLYGQANVAADHNQMLMQALEKVAELHGFTALTHEKPFAGVNGSGKHLNWSLATDTGHNLLEPGHNPHENLRFLAVLAATLLGVKKHASLLRASVASYGNDYRLGANEAPPAIMSVFLGDQLTAICEELAAGEQPSGKTGANTIELALGGLPDLDRDSTDRNRTSPFAFTGNKFEFRAVGSNQSVSWPLTCVNLVVADGLSELCDRIESRWSGEASILQVVKEVISETRDVCFEGNNYSAEWLEEAARRGLPNLRNTPEALAHLRTDAVVELFARHNVLNAAELESRFHVQIDQYVTAVKIEVELLNSMVGQSVLPAAVAERTALATDIAALRGAAPDLVSDSDLASLTEMSKAVDALRVARVNLTNALAAVSGLEGLAEARAIAANLLPRFGELRVAADAVEERVADERWTLPKYREMLFQNS
jgi:glutamine synthetase